MNGEEARLERVSPAVIKEISAQWAEFTAEEKTALTAETLKELEERRDNRLEGTHNTQLAACHDVRVTLNKVKEEVCEPFIRKFYMHVITYRWQLDNLHARTGVAVLLMATRSDLDAFGNPVVYHSDERVQHFMESTTGATLEDTVLRLEAYCISGLEGEQSAHGMSTGNLRYLTPAGVVGNQLERTLELKAKLRSLILTKLRASIPFVISYVYLILTYF